MPSALDWLATAQECFADDYGSLRQGLLTSVFALLIGMERVFHLDEMEVAKRLVFLDRYLTLWIFLAMTRFLIR